ncbi:MAG: S8 family serine peptidase, partial [Nanoarchaeota archaeon]|nr:S8 family serine peptidase [Nanoarchaeota archaeon]
MKQKNQYLVLFVALFLLVISSTLAVEVEQEVIEALQQDSETSVIVILKDVPGKTETTKVLDDLILSEKSTQDNTGTPSLLSDTPLTDYDFDLEKKFSSIPGFSGIITEEGLEKLENDPRVESIFLDKIFHISLDTSAALINANDVWNFSVGGYNITGKGETVCILDTGIDTDHPAFQDKIKSQYCYCSGCCPGGGSQNNSAEDDHGHGTHVAGIAAGNLTTYTGIAKDAGIYAIKVCNSAGSCVTSDLIAGIDRCSDSANISAFNISVISISLGDTSQNNAYCNNDATAASINTAVGKNISVVIAAGNNNSVVIAAGNDGFTAGISSPACVQNATAVGAVNDNDAISYNRGLILQLLAPGVSITSAARGGGTTTLSGTSMSAPHMSGAVAIFRQYWRLAYSKTPTVDEIKRKFMISGKLIDDSSNSGKNYSRIDILAALQPFMNFTDTSAVNNSVIGVNNSFINITSDVNLTNSLLEWNYNNGSRVNITLTKVNGTHFYLNVTHLKEGADTYSIYGNDTVGTIGISATRTITLDFTVPAVTISNPANGSNFSSGTQAFNASISDVNINTVIFQFNNASGNDFNVTPGNVSGNWNTLFDLTRLTDGLQSMTVYANDSARNINNTQLVEFTIDRTPPAVTFISPTNGQNYTLSSGNQTFNATVTDATLTVHTVLFSFDNASGTGFNITAVNQSGYWVASYNVSTLANGSHSITIFTNDTVGNTNNSQSINFTVDLTPLTITLLTPVTGNQNSSTSMTFNCSVRDYVELTNLTLYGNWSGWHANETKTITGNSSSATFSKTLSDGMYLWNCLGYDSLGNSAFASSNFTLTIDTIAPIISSVSSGTPASTS